MSVVLPEPTENLSGTAIVTAELISSEIVHAVEIVPVVRKSRSWRSALLGIVPSVWELVSLLLLLAIAAAIPIVQFATLGYMLKAGGNLAARKRWRDALPGRALAGRIAAFALWSMLLWLPVWFVSDLAYRVQLLRPTTDQAANWRLIAFGFAATWLLWVGWAAARGGRLRHFLWPRPIKFLREFWRPSTWSRIADRLWSVYVRSRIVSLWWLGARCAVGALLWTVVPVSLMIIGLRAQALRPAGFVGLVGAMTLAAVMLYLPVLQLHFASTNRFSSLFDVGTARARFRHAPWAVALSLLILFALCIPLYLLRIEPIPAELAWLPSLAFVGLMLPAKIILGAALGYAAGRQRPRGRLVRSSAKLLAIAAVLFYVGSLYVAQFVAWQGVYVMYFQHSVLIPTPLVFP